MFFRDNPGQAGRRAVGLLNFSRQPQDSFQNPDTTYCFLISCRWDRIRLIIESPQTLIELEPEDRVRLLILTSMTDRGLSINAYEV
jgi:hypothetical protein